MRQTSGRPPVPGPAERAKTIATRGGQAMVLRSRTSGGGALYWSEGAQPHLHHVHPDGVVTVLLPTGHRLTRAFGDAPEGLPAMIEITDRAPVPLREPVRGLLWISGWLSVLDTARARTEALAVAEQRPDSRLLDVGHGMTVLRLLPASLVLADGDGASSVPTAGFTAARPDPFCHFEDHWLRHLDMSHRDVVGMLTRLVPEPLRGGHVRPLGLDRCGLRLRVETSDCDHDVRLAFARPVATPAELGVEMRRLVGCPFLAQTNTA